MINLWLGARSAIEDDFQGSRFLILVTNISADCVREIQRVFRIPSGFDARLQEIWQLQTVHGYNVTPHIQAVNTGLVDIIVVIFQLLVHVGASEVLFEPTRIMQNAYTVTCSITCTIV